MLAKIIAENNSLEPWQSYWKPIKSKSKSQLLLLATIHVYKQTDNVHTHQLV